jgi:hypothetical protein
MHQLSNPIKSVVAHDQQALRENEGYILCVRAITEGR